MPWLRILSRKYMCFNAIRENKILVKISEFTVSDEKPRQTVQTQIRDHS